MNLQQLWTKGQDIIGRYGGKGLNHLMPTHCLLCRDAIALPQSFCLHLKLCGPCWQGLDYLPPYGCAICGHPFDVYDTMPLACTACLQKPPPYTKARSVFLYRKRARHLILQYKNNRRLDYGRFLALTMAPALLTLLKDHKEPAYLVPVPLHWQRLWYRGFNQSDLLAFYLAQETGQHYEPQALKRVRSTPKQTQLSRSHRLTNVKKAFCLSQKYKDTLSGQVIVLIDDVMTTGATIDACVKALKPTKPAVIYVLTAARVL
jgi:ComF family protein